MAKFIEVTKSYKERKVIINLDDISLIGSNYENESETDIFFRDSSQITIKESYTYITNIIMRIEND